MTTSPSHVHWWRRAPPGVLASAPLGLMLVVSIAILPALERFASSEANEMMNLLGALKSTTLPANNFAARTRGARGRGSRGHGTLRSHDS